VTAKRIALLRASTACVLSLVTNLGFAKIGGTVKDDFAMPGALLAMLGSNAGLYDTPSGAWAVVCIVGNLVFYAIVWWIILRTVSALLTSQASRE
jgi:hypothetical protein